MNKIVTDKDEQINLLVVGMKRIVTGSPMDYEEIAKECLEQIGINTKDPKNFKIL